jgi:hypothetical protein
VPPELVLGNRNFPLAMHGVELPDGGYLHICGIDILRDEQGVFRVLEDQARTPPGVTPAGDPHRRGRGVQLSPVSDGGSGSMPMARTSTSPVGSPRTSPGSLPRSA